MYNNYSDFLNEFEKIQQYIKNNDLSKVLKDIEDIRKSLDRTILVEDKKDFNIQNEYKLLVQTYPKTKCLFNIEMNITSWLPILSPKDDKCDKNH